MHRLGLFVVIGSLATVACDDESRANQGAITSSPDGGGAGPASAGDAAASGSGGDDASERGAEIDAGRGAAGSAAANSGAAGGAVGAAGSGVSAGASGRDSAAGGSRAGGSAAGGPAPDQPLPSLRVYSDTSSIEFTPALLAAQSIYPGMATVQTGGIANLFNAGQADLATNAETQALRQSVQHPNLRIVFSVTETFYRIVADRSAGIAQLADLRGKRVGTVTNTSAHYYLDKMLRTVGLTVADVSVVSVFPLSRLPPMLQSGQLAAATSWEPEPQNAVDLLGTNAIEFQDRSVYREIVNLHTTAENLNDPEKRRAIVAFVRALVPAAERFQNSPEMVWPLVSEAIGYEEALLAKVWKNERFPGTLVGDLLDVLVEEDVWVAQQSGRAPRDRAQLATLIDDSVVKEALAAP